MKLKQIIVAALVAFTLVPASHAGFLCDAKCAAFNVGNAMSSAAASILVATAGIAVSPVVLAKKTDDGESYPAVVGDMVTSFGDFVGDQADLNQAAYNICVSECNE
jgi:hypothetical protein